MDVLKVFEEVKEKRGSSRRRRPEGYLDWFEVLAIFNNWISIT